MPILVVCDSCQANYSLKDEYAGKKLKCKTCGAILIAPSEYTLEIDTSDKGYHPAFDRDKFLVNQQRIAISEKYYVYSADQKAILFIVRPAHFLRNLGAAFAAIFAFVFVFGIGAGVSVYFSEHLKNNAGTAASLLIGLVAAIVAAFWIGIRLSPKRHIYVYADDSQQRLLLEVFQDQKIHLIRATYTVFDPVDGLLGRFEKNYFYNFFRKKWLATAPDGSLIVVAWEDSLILSLLRRFLGPMLGLLRTNFIICRPDTEQVIGEFNRRMTLFDRYVLDLTADRGHLLDRRLAIALGVLLDTGERR